MTEIIIGFVTALVVFAGVWMLWFKKSQSVAKKPVFTCSNCGEKHCDCHKEN